MDLFSPMPITRYLLIVTERILALLVYVDDIAVAANVEEACSKFKNYLHSYFSIKDLGPLKYFLGIEVAHGP